MKPSTCPPVSPIRRMMILPALAMVALSLSGCAAVQGTPKLPPEPEGIGAEKRAADEKIAELTKAGTPPLQGTTSSIPSLVPGEGEPLLQAPPPPPATAPPAGQFDEKNAQHLLARCRDRSARHDWFDAVGDCRKAAELEPQAVEPQVELMRLLVTLQSYGEAEEAAKKVLAARPDDPVALYYLAWSYRGRDRYPEAIATLEKAIARDPKRVEYVQALAMTWCLAENYGKGIAIFEQALAMAPNDQRTKASLDAAKSTLVEKLAPYRRMVKEKPNSYEAQAAFGFMLQRYGLPDKALNAYDLALSRMPTPLPDQDKDIRTLAAQIYYNRGVVYRELSRPDQAEPALWQSMQLDPSLAAQAWYIVGLARYDAGKYDPSIDALRKSIDLAPDVAENRAALADAYDKAGKGDLAREQRNAVAAIRAREESEKEAARQERKALEAEAEAQKPAKPTVPMTPTAAPAVAPVPEPAAETD